jgi:hypothetical protein
VAEPVAFGARTLDIPAPNGFVATANDAPGFLQASQRFLPAQNRLVEMYLLPDDKASLLLPQPQNAQPELDRYFQVQVLRGYEGRLVPAEDFASSSAAIEARLEKSLGDAEDRISKLTRRGERDLEEKTGRQVDVDIDRVRYLGVFRRERWGLFFTVASHVQVNTDGGTGHAGPLIAAGAIALVNHQLVVFYAYGKGEEEAVRRAAESALSTWVDQVRAANPDDPDLTGQPSKPGFELTSIGRGALIGAGCGALIGCSRDSSVAARTIGTPHLPLLLLTARHHASISAG